MYSRVYVSTLEVAAKIPSAEMTLVYIPSPTIQLSHKGFPFPIAGSRNSAERTESRHTPEQSRLTVVEVFRSG